MENKATASLEPRSQHRKLLVIVLLIASILRIVSLGDIPPHLSPDEAALGYNAYSILKTGSDERGEFLPIIFRSFGDYKPGLYIYLTVPFVAVFGLTEFAVRLPSALLGVIAVWLLYEVMRYLRLYEFFVNKPNSGQSSFYDAGGFAAIVAAFLLAISPWHIHFSRGTWEVNLALTLTLFGILFFLKSRKNRNYLILSAVFFASTLLSYQGAKLSTGLVVVLLALIYWNDLVKIRIHAAASIFVGLLISLPIILSLFQGKASVPEMFSLFSYPRPEEYLSEFLDKAGESQDSLVYYLFHNEPLNFARGVAARWYNHLSGRFLFFEGDWQNLRHGAPNHGTVLLFYVFALPWGLYAMLSKKINKNALFVLLWLLIAPLPAVLSNDQVHAVRAYYLVIPLTIIASLGTVGVINKVSQFSGWTRRAWDVFIISIFSASFIFIVDAYFVHLPKRHAQYWNFGYREVFEYMKDTGVGGTVLFQQSYNQPYIYYLFYGKIDPKYYQNQANLSGQGLDVGLVESVDNIDFKFFSWPVEESYDVVIGDNVVIPDDIGGNYLLEKQVRYPDGMTAFKILRKAN